MLGHSRDSSPPSLNGGHHFSAALPYDSWLPPPPSCKTLKAHPTPPSLCVSVTHRFLVTSTSLKTLAPSSLSSTPAHILPLTGWNQLQTPWPLSSLTPSSPRTHSTSIHLFARFHPEPCHHPGLLLSDVRNLVLSLCDHNCLCIPVQWLNYSKYSRSLTSSTPSVH